MRKMISAKKRAVFVIKPVHAVSLSLNPDVQLQLMICLMDLHLWEYYLLSMNNVAVELKYLNCERQVRLETLSRGFQSKYPYSIYLLWNQVPEVMIRAWNCSKIRYNETLMAFMKSGQAVIGAYVEWLLVVVPWLLRTWLSDIFKTATWRKVSDFLIPFYPHCILSNRFTYSSTITQELFHLRVFF